MKGVGCDIRMALEPWPICRGFFIFHTAEVLPTTSEIRILLGMPQQTGRQLGADPREHLTP